MTHYHLINDDKHMIICGGWKHPICNIYEVMHTYYWRTSDVIISSNGTDHKRFSFRGKSGFILKPINEISSCDGFKVMLFISSEDKSHHPQWNNDMMCNVCNYR